MVNGLLLEICAVLRVKTPRWVNELSEFCLVMMISECEFWNWAEICTADSLQFKSKCAVIFAVEDGRVSFRIVQGVTVRPGIWRHIWSPTQVCVYVQDGTEKKWNIRVLCYIHVRATFSALPCSSLILWIPVAGWVTLTLPVSTMCSYCSSKMTDLRWFKVRQKF